MVDTSLPPLRIGQVALTVHDIDRVTEFYRSVLGLEFLAKDGAIATLGAGEVPLLELRRDVAARQHDRREVGLFHTAFLLPTRGDLGRWLSHATQRGVLLQGAADHGVSEALYLSDPEGNGIEIYADRPRDRWTMRGDMVEMPNDPIELPELAASGAGEAWHGAPAGTTVGHVHLQVGDIPQAEAFYRDRLGLALTWRYPKASFYGSGGYHHHVATNVWNSLGAGTVDRPVTGLAEIQLLASDAAVLTALAGGVPVDGDDVLLQDPWGNAFRVVAG